MSQLSMADMNSLNAIAGYLRHTGFASDERASQVLLSVQKKATDLLDQIDTIVDIVYELLDEYDIKVWEDIDYVPLADVWIEAVQTDQSEEAIKSHLKAFLLFKRESC